MYLIDFWKKIKRKSNIPVIIYLVLNMLFIEIAVQFVFGSFEIWMSLLLSFVLYTISLAIALSPVGEWILRLQTGCKKIVRVEQISFIEPIFTEVYEKAKRLDSSISEDIQLFISGDESSNAFATGRKTICITEGLLNEPEEQIKAVLGHEFGHLAHKDTDLILVVTVGNFIFTVFMTIIKLLFGIIKLFIVAFGSSVEDDYDYGDFICSSIIVDELLWIWTKIGTMLVMKSSRSNEYEADVFSYNLGYGEGLCVFLDSIETSETKGLFATLESSHPDKNYRIAKLQELGSVYRATYGTEISSQSVDSSQQMNDAVAMQSRLAMVGFAKTVKSANKIKCSFCGTKIPDDSNFCPECGNKVI